MVRLGLMMGAALALALSACGGGRSVNDTSEGDAGSGASGAEAEAGPEAGQEGEAGAEVGPEAEAEAEASSVTDSSAETDSAETGSAEACAIALHLDTCCTQPVPASHEELETDPCLVTWPVDWESIPQDQLAACVELQPMWCELVDCDYVEPPTEVVEPDETGGCRWVCPEGEGIAYINPGCGDPPAIASCTPPPPPCAEEYCSCEGETIYGCGQTGEPYEHMGPCE